MKPRLTVVLDLRRAAEDAAKREVGRLERERLPLAERLEADRTRLAAGSAGDVPLDMREQFAAFRRAMLGAIAADQARLAAHDKVIDAARDVLAAAHREVKAIEAIRARDAKAEGRRQLRREGRANDEHAARARLEAVV
jgi:flagellar export protein FliJ